MAKKTKALDKKAKKKIVFGVALILIAFCLYYVKNDFPGRPRSAKLSEKSGASDKKLEWGYQFDYPQDWYFNSGNKQAVASVALLSSQSPNEEKNGNNWIDIQIAKAERGDDELPLDVISRLNENEQQYGRPAPMISQAEELSVGENVVYKQMITPQIDGEEPVLVYYIFSKEKKLAILSVRPYNSIYMDQVEPILTSFEFIDQM